MIDFTRPTADELLMYRAALDDGALAQRRARGPAFIKIGPKVVYRGSDLNAWLEANTVRHEPVAA